MPKSYYLKHKDTIIGVFTEEMGKLNYDPLPSSADKLPLRVGYPYGLFEVDKTTAPWQPNKRKVASYVKINQWLTDRVFSKDRPDAKKLLQEVGLVNYNPWDIVKKTKGITHHDNYWITDESIEQFPKSTGAIPTNEINKVTRDLRSRFNGKNKKYYSVLKSNNSGIIKRVNEELINAKLNNHTIKRIDANHIRKLVENLKIESKVIRLNGKIRVKLLPSFNKIEEFHDVPSKMNLFNNNRGNE